MSNEKKKTEPPLFINVKFGEALARFAATNPSELDENIERSKTKKPPRDIIPRRPALESDKLKLSNRKRKPDNF